MPDFGNRLGAYPVYPSQNALGYSEPADFHTTKAWYGRFYVTPTVPYNTQQWLRPSQLLAQPLAGYSISNIIVPRQLFGIAIQPASCFMMPQMLFGQGYPCWSHPFAIPLPLQVTLPYMPPKSGSAHFPYLCQTPFHPYRPIRPVTNQNALVSHAQGTPTLFQPKPGKTTGQEFTARLYPPQKSIPEQPSHPEKKQVKDSLPTNKSSGDIKITLLGPGHNPPHSDIYIQDKSGTAPITSVNAGDPGLYVGGAAINDAFHRVVHQPDEYTQLHKYLLKSSEAEKVVHFDNPENTSTVQVSTVLKDNQSGGTRQDGTVIVNIFKDGHCPFNNTHNRSMTYIIPPKQIDYKSDQDFLAAVEQTAANMVRAVDSCNYRLATDNRRELVTPVLRVCGFSSGTFAGDVPPEIVAAAIQRGIYRQMKAPGYHHTIREIEYENGSAELFSDSFKPFASERSAVSPKPLICKSVTIHAKTDNQTIPDQRIYQIASLEGLSLNANDLPEIFSRINKATLSQPYYQGSPEQISLGENIVYRPNHNGVHARRKVAYTETIIDLIQHKGSDSSKQILARLSPQRKNVIQLATYLMRAGRLNEHAGGDSYHDRSAELFKAYAQQLNITDSDIQWGATLIREAARSPQPEFSKDPETVLARNIMTIAHECDLVRCYDPQTIQTDIKIIRDTLKCVVNSSENSDHISNRLLDHAVKVTGSTGDKLSYPTQQNYHADFYRCSTDNRFCEQAISRISPPQWSDGSPEVSPARHYSFRPSAATITTDQIYASRPVINDKQITVQFVKGLGGAPSVGYDYSKKYPKAKIGMMVAANSGLPAGDIGHVVLGHKDGTIKHYLNHGGQEENMVANWAETLHPEDISRQKSLIKQSLIGQWGLSKHDDSTSTETIQGIDYVNTKRATDFADAWVVPDTKLSGIKGTKGSYSTDPAKVFDTTLIFGAGPNTSPGKTLEGSMRRTQNNKASQDYGFFLDCIKNTIRAKFDAGIAAGVTVMLLDKTSCGIYAHTKKYKKDLAKDYPKLVQDILNEPVGPKGEKRYQYIHDAVIADLLHTS